jgi:cyclic beta-1,2-glucan synthetase
LKYRIAEQFVNDSYRADSDSLPAKEELLSIDRLVSLAESTNRNLETSVDPRLKRNIGSAITGSAAAIYESFCIVSTAAKQGKYIPPAAEWLLDNAHLIDEQLKSVKRDWTSRTAVSLPVVTSPGADYGFARIYVLTQSLIAHSDSNLEISLLKRFYIGAQRGGALNMSELWAIPLILRCVLVENLARLARQLTLSYKGRQMADEVAGGPRMGEQEVQRLLGTDRAGIMQAFHRAMLARLAHGFSYRDTGAPENLLAFSKHLETLGLDWGAVVEAERNSQTAANTTVRNIFVSLRILESANWAEIVESISVVDQRLRGTPLFSALDYRTRDRYRKAIEELAKASSLSEVEIADAIVSKCKADNRTANTDSKIPRYRDPGYYLISSGRAQFEHEIGFRLPWYRRVLRRYVRHATQIYIGAIAAITGILCVALALYCYGDAESRASLVLLAAIGCVPLSEVAVVIVNRCVAKLLNPRHLPRLDFSTGVPEQARTFVVVPTLLSSAQGACGMAEQLEIHFLANPKGMVHFALLTDWPDSDNETETDDDSIVGAARDAIAKLNLRYGTLADGTTRFFVLHRTRCWSASESKWIGWERKRGKLAEFNQLLRGSVTTSFMVSAQDRSRLPPNVRYVITLDADTRLPLNAVGELVGAAAHPLNAPELDPKSKRVVSGYGILQPRVTPRLPSARDSSIFQRLFTGASGVDPYASAASDVYQDLFGAGSFTGKGLYDVDVFEAAVSWRISENTVLSHDLLESAFARCALISDVEVFEDFPSHSEVAAARFHRWVRGDWQLLPWIVGRARQDIAGIDRWKLFDNLRRSLLAPFATTTLITSWCVLGVTATAWFIAMACTLSLPMFLSLLGSLIPPAGASRRHHWRVVGDEALRAGGHLLVRISLLAPEAWLVTDAIYRTLWRLTITRKHLLEWTTAAQVQSRTGFALGHFRWPLQSAALVAMLASGMVLYFNNGAFYFCLPLILLWWGSPVIARTISLPPKSAAKTPLTATDAQYLRLIARRTWGYFTRFVTESEHWLPPDNYQEAPPVGLARRTSPTNIGLALLVNPVAYEMGWIGITEMVERLERTLTAIRELPKFRGHLFNWYDTSTMQPLVPRYVSTVDSGNLAGHLIALEQACCEAGERPLVRSSHLPGVRDCLALLRDATRDDRSLSVVNCVDPLLNTMEALIAQFTEVAIESTEHWYRLRTAATNVAATVRGCYSVAIDDSTPEAIYWADALCECIESAIADVEVVPQGVCAMTPGISLRAIAQHAAGCRQCHGHEQNRNAEKLLARLDGIASTARELVKNMDFSLLFDSDRMMFATGYRDADGQLDESYYDLLASESRLTSFVAICKGDAPAAHWFKLGRPMRPIAGDALLLSWSGSMFEYLMPALVMYNVSNSLLDNTCKLVVAEQVAYGGDHGVPWGVSESAFAKRDRNEIYQYAPFGVPGLGFKRGLARDLVVAPYATVLGAMVDKTAALKNMLRLQRQGALGRYGFYEALDFTPSRLPDGETQITVKAYFAHHQGMSLVALGNVLLGDVVRHWFHRHASVQAADLLLQERPPKEVVPSQLPRDEDDRPRVKDLELPAVRRFFDGNRVRPCAHLLSNGNYAVMVDVAGSGYSKHKDLLISRWREDPTCDAFGTYFYLRDTHSGVLWSATTQPVNRLPDQYEAQFSEQSALIRRSDDGITVTTEIVVSPEDNAEVRHLILHNTGANARDLELTSYAELALSSLAADTAHPVFSKLFIRTEYLAKEQALLATRRAREPQETELWVAHVLAYEPNVARFVGFDTDRALFLGRNGDVSAPAGLSRSPASSLGEVLDPVFSLRVAIRLDAGTSAHISYATLYASSREGILKLVDKYHDPRTFHRILSMSWVATQAHLYHLGVTADEANTFQYLADALLFPGPSLRHRSEQFLVDCPCQQVLWSLGVSGDLPILLLRIDDIDKRDYVRQLLRAHDYFCSKQFAVDLVVLNEKPGAYAEDLRRLLQDMTRDCMPSPQRRRGERFLFNRDEMPAKTAQHLLAAARVVIDSNLGSLSDQVLRLHKPKSPETMLSVTARLKPVPESNLANVAIQDTVLQSDNGLGGFSPDGREYVIKLGPGQFTPAPWANVIANEAFGCVVTESGGGYVWSENSRENQLTPWSNDPVTDLASEVIYLRDERNGTVWTPTAGPIRIADAAYRISHGQGYTRFEHCSNAILSELLIQVAPDIPVKQSVLTLENKSQRERTLSIYYFAEWALGPARAVSAPYIATEWNNEVKAVFARNPWNTDFWARVAFLSLGESPEDWTADRTEFLGRNGSVRRPKAVINGTVLKGTSGVGFDPCAALRIRVTLGAGQRTTIVALLGQAQDVRSACSLIKTARASRVRERIQTELVRHWDAVLGTLQVETPDPEMNLLLNRWLLYQVLACRLWGRSGFYQAGGAYGFRDQLQDAMALCVSQPRLVRAHLVRAAARQFDAGDVQHWWHPPSGRGVRTHCSDDRLWLPYVSAYYALVTGDREVFHENIPYLQGEAVPPDREASYFTPITSPITGTLYDHCARAIESSLAVGTHGLPLIGTGDWNDGINRVGHEGAGESVWLAWFLYATLMDFSAIASWIGQPQQCERWRTHAKSLQAALEANAWDGDWYRRAYYDDGTPLGTAGASECRIDSLAQSWSVLSGAGSPGRARRAMESVREQLVKTNDKLILLFTPPFEKSDKDPGYIRSYPPGVRENGGQYTHAAVWCVQAMAKLGDGDSAYRWFRLLNPLTHASTPAAMARYKVEPYVVAADIYAEPPHTGRGGWTWYTGAAGWLYRAGVESILGIEKRGDHLHIRPCIPRTWGGFRFTLQLEQSSYEVRVNNPEGVMVGVTGLTVDGQQADVAEGVRLIDDGRQHRVTVVMG